MAALTETTLDRQNVTPGYEAAANGGDTFTNGGNQFLLMRNTSGGPITVTIVTTRTVDGLAVPDLEVIVPANDHVVVGQFDTQTYGLTVSMTYTTEVGLEIAVTSF